MPDVDKISDLGEVTVIGASSRIIIDYSGGTKYIKKSNLELALMADWTKVPNFQFDGAVAEKVWKPGTGDIVSVEAYTVGATGVTVGTMVKPTIDNGYFYECVTEGDCDTAEPTSWGRTIGADTTDGTVKWRCHGWNVLDMEEDLSSLLYPGMALRYYNGSMKYGIVGHCNADNLCIVGAPLDNRDSTLFLHYSVNRTVGWEGHISGTYGDGPVDTLLLTDMGRASRWQQSIAAVVDFAAGHETPAATTQPYINVMVDGAEVSLQAEGNGMQPGTLPTFQCHGVNAAGYYFADIDASKYGIQYGGGIEIACKVAGVGDASNLTVCATLVLE